MTWVKICGITNVQDALAAVDAGADALGFVFYEKSPRHVTQDTVRDIVGKLPASIEKVGVFVEESFEQMEDVAEKAGLTGVQVHISLSRSLRGESRTFTSKTAKYIAMRANELIDEQGRFKGFAWTQGAGKRIQAIFLDSGTETQPGGTGKAFDWKKAARTMCALQRNFRVVVAGGLTPTNVTEAMDILKPWGVDVSSGVEASPGKKDPDKIRAFIAAVRHADQGA
ncbi:MAG: phosphoribosylanthranilate isomerase [Terriglobales bacterium]